MKVICLGDPHAKITRFDLFLKYLKWVEQLVVTEQPDFVVNLGDTFHDHAMLRAEIKSEFRDHVDYVISKTKLRRYFYVLGNHDFYRKDDSKYHALKDWAGTDDGLVVVDSPSSYSSPNPTDITFVPYLPDHTKFPKDTKRIVFAHQTFVGADYGNQRPEIGVVSEDVSSEVIISGHIHKPQTFGKVIYVGSAYSQNLDDLDQIKHVLIFDTETYEKRFVTVPLPSWLKCSYVLSEIFTVDNMHEMFVERLIPGHHWVLEITGPKAEIISYLESVRYKQLQVKNDIRVVPKFTDHKKKRTQIKATSIYMIVDEYLEKVYTGSIDKTLVKDKVLELLDKTKVT
jgi:DNA repair exonuclease SbcCD nuclease subunit